MRDYSNSGLVAPSGVTIKGHHNIVQMETRNEKKDRFEIMEQPQASQGEVATGLSQDLATKYSTIYEKPYVVPFSNVSQQMPERAVGVKVGEGTAVSEDIRPLKVYVNPLRNEPSKTDKIDEPTGIQEFTKSYEKTPLPDTVEPAKPLPEPTFGSFETDPLFPAQTPAEYKQSERIPMSIEYNNKKRAYEVTYDDGSRRTLKMSRAGDKKLYKELTGRDYVPGQSPSKGYKSAMKSLLNK
jgi:hypothetical protein